MSFTKLTVSQNEFLVSHLRGTGAELSAKQAAANYGIKNLRARMSEIRDAGLIVRTRKNYEGANAYTVSARNIWGSRAKTIA